MSRMQKKLYNIFKYKENIQLTYPIPALCDFDESSVRMTYIDTKTRKECDIDNIKPIEDLHNMLFLARKKMFGNESKKRYTLRAKSFNEFYMIDILYTYT